MVLTLGIIYGLIAAIGWGVGDFFTKQVAEKLGTWKTILLQSLVGLPVYVAISLFFWEWPSFSSSQWIILGIIVLLWAMVIVFFTEAIRRGPLILVLPIGASYPLVSIVLGLLFLSEVLTTTQVIAISFLILGTMLIAMQKIPGGRVLGKYGPLFAVVSTVGWGTLLVLIKPLVDASNFIMPFTVIYIVVLPFLVIAGIVWRKQAVNAFRSSHRTPIIASQLAYIFGFVGFAIGISNEQVSIVAPVSALFPVTTLILGAVFLKEKFSKIQVLGFVLALIGLIIVSS